MSDTAFLIVLTLIVLFVILLNKDEKERARHFDTFNEPRQIPVIFAGVTQARTKSGNFRAVRVVGWDEDDQSYILRRRGHPKGPVFHRTFQDLAPR